MEKDVEMRGNINVLALEDNKPNVRNGNKIVFMSFELMGPLMIFKPRFVSSSVA